MILELVAETNTPWTTTYAPLITGGAALAGVLVGAFLQLILHRSEQKHAFKAELRSEIKQLASAANRFSTAMIELYQMAGKGQSADKAFSEVSQKAERTHADIDRLAIGLLTCGDEAITSTAHAIQKRNISTFSSYYSVPNWDQIPQLSGLQSAIDDLMDEVFILITIISPSNRSRPLFQSRSDAVEQVKRELASERD